MTNDSKRKEDSNSRLVRLADVKSEEVDWLWYPYIPLGKLTSLEGDPGIGKSTVGLAIATDVSVGKGLPGAPETEPTNVLLASAEDGLADTIRPRLERMGADVTRIHAIQGNLNFASQGISKLKGYIESLSPALVIIDPLVAYIGASVDIYRANETREVMAKLADLAEYNFVSILIVRHLTKASQAKAIYRGQGSIDITAACRSVLLAGCNPQDTNERALFHIKSNLAPQGVAIGYRLEEGKLLWTGESRLTLAQVLSSSPEEDKSAIDEAVEFLLDELRDGPIEAVQVFSDAKNLQIAEKTVKRAKGKLGIISRREGEPGKKGGGKFLWELPENSQNYLEGQISIYGPLGPLNNDNHR
ncbi:AAA family ATPase, partial [Chloroflexota bacterium]